MSCLSNIALRPWQWRSRLIGLVCCAALVALCLASRAAQAQTSIPVTIMVCQTPLFWCAVPTQEFPTGMPCYCNTLGGPVGGYAINPRQVVQQAPRPRADKGGGGAHDSDDEIDLGDKADDCLNGLGNCNGSFKSLVSSRATSRSSGSSNSSASSSGCTKDTDCKGDRVCEHGNCQEPKH